MACSSFDHNSNALNQNEINRFREIKKSFKINAPKNVF